VGTLVSTLPLLAPSFLSPPLPFCPLLYLNLSSPLLSGGNNFNDFPDNQLTTDFAFLCKPAWGNAITVSPCPDIIWGMASPTKYFGERRSPRSLLTTPLGLASITLK